MLLAAGRGSRLRPLTDQTPKPLLRVADQPLIDHQLQQLAAAGVTDAVVNLFHLGEQIAAHLRTTTVPGLRVRCSKEPALLETGGGLLFARPLLTTEQVWVLNGDVLLDLPLQSFPRALQPDEDLHLLLVPKPAARAQGDFEYADGRVIARGDRFVYGCFALLSLPALERYAATLPPPTAGTSRAFSLQGWLFDRVAAGRVGATVHDGYWFDIGTPAQLTAADRFLRQRRR